jgi:hypothetical protein
MWNAGGKACRISESEAVYGEGDEPLKLKHYNIREFCFGGWADKVDIHTLCLSLLRAIVAAIPLGGPVDLVWRERPDYQVWEDKDTRHKKHSIYARLAWVSAEEGIFTEQQPERTHRLPLPFEEGEEA